MTLIILLFISLFSLSSSQVRAQTASDMYCEFVAQYTLSGVRFDMQVAFGTTQSPTQEQLNLMPLVVSVLNLRNEPVGQVFIPLNRLTCDNVISNYVCASTPQSPIINSLSSLGISQGTTEQTYNLIFDTQTTSACKTRTNIRIPASTTNYPECNQTVLNCRPASTPISNGVLCSEAGVIKSCCPEGSDYDSTDNRCKTETGGVLGGPVTREDFDRLNPLKIAGDPEIDISTPGGLISRVLEFAFPIAGFILFVMIFWGGFEILYGSSTSKNIEAGRKRVTAALIGFFLLFASYWIIQILEVVLGIKVF